MSTPSPPPWPHCGQGADPATDPVGCRGIHVSGHAACLAHLADSDRNAYLAGLTPGADIDHRGTPFTEDLLNKLLAALANSTQRPHLGYAWFEGAQFSGDASFIEAEFSGHAGFEGAQFSGYADFDAAQFTGDARFGGAQFSRRAGFDEAQFSATATFYAVQFSGEAGFVEACFSLEARFGEARFSSPARFDNAQFSRAARFDNAQFTGDARFGGAQFSGEALFVGARFAGPTRFDEAQFSGPAQFTEAQFTGDARFAEAQFSSLALFDEAQFAGPTRFDNAQFYRAAQFHRAQFSRETVFHGAQFSGEARFSRSQFSGEALFVGARFSSEAWFVGAQFSGTASFEGAQFSTASWWGPVVCAEVVNLSGAVFEAPVTLEIAAGEVRCARTRWESTATVRVRHARVDFGYAVLAAPVAVTAHPVAFSAVTGYVVDESLLWGPATVQVVSVEGVDAAMLVLTDVDLSDCLFSGAFHLDQLRLEGRTLLAPPPVGWHRRGIRPIHWTRRRTLAEEHHWRAQTAGQVTPPAGRAPSPRLWRSGPHHPDPARTPDPDDVAALYRQLRKAFEDGKNEPGAADFYYGECEMRRHDRTGTPRVERGLLWAYWLLSGYGLRATRALGWLGAAMLCTIILLMGCGLPASSPKQEATGTVPADGGKVTFEIDKGDPQNPTGDRFTSERFEKALNITLNSVVFRSSGQDLTTTGTYIEMTSRLLEPALLALAVLAVRGRIKR